MDPKAINLGDIETIQSMETARMALRWALERIQAHEKTVRELEEAVDAAVKSRKRDVDSMAAHKSWVEDREKYFKSMENLFGMLTQGEFDIPAFAEKEVAVERMRRGLDEARVRLEAEFEARRADLELNYRDLHDAAREEAASGRKALEEAKVCERDVEERRRLLEADRLRQEDILAEGLKAIEAREKSLEERIVNADAVLQKRRDDLEKEYAALRVELNEELRQNRRAWEGERRRQVEVLEKAWPGEKASLEAELRGQTQRAQMAESLVDVTKKNLVDLEARLKDAELRLQRERSEMTASLARWRESIEGILAERLAELDAEQARRIELLESREGMLRARDRDWHDCQNKIMTGLSEKSRQIEGLRKELLDTIRSYQERAEGAQAQKEEGL